MPSGPAEGVGLHAPEPTDLKQRGLLTRAAAAVAAIVAACLLLGSSGGAAVAAVAVTVLAIHSVKRTRRLSRALELAVGRERRAGREIVTARQTEERFRSLFRASPYPQIVIDASGRIVLANTRAERLFRYGDGQLDGRRAADLIPVQGGLPWYLRVGPAAPPAGRQLDLRARRADGSEFPAEVSLTPLGGEDAGGGLVAAAILDETERKMVADELAHRASHDDLTGLPNRGLFLDRLEHAIARARRSRRTLAVMFLDLDDFKLVNDTRGHDVGDLLLVALTPRLKAALRPGDTIARFGGDEFVVLCEDLRDESVARRIAERVATACNRPVTIGDYEHVATVSVGLVLVSDPDGATPSGVLRDADAAMYRAKDTGKGRIEMFDESLRAKLMDRMAVESSLRRALDRDELRLVYQPVVALGMGTIVAVEALLRWQHPRRGLLEPRDFMATAESSGLIVQIGEWVIEQACRQAAAWRDATPPGSTPVRMSVNVSPRQLAQPDLPDRVRQILERTGLEPGLLELEVTERMLFEDADSGLHALTELKALGVRLVLDDFGTGYSSLSYLRHLTIDALKIDRSFVEGLGSEREESAIVSAVLSMAGLLGLGVTAEGVETRRQLSRLRQHGCEFAQGFLFHHPQPAAEISGLLGLSDERSQLTA